MNADLFIQIVVVALIALIAIFVVVTLAFFAVCVAYARKLDRI